MLLAARSLVLALEESKPESRDHSNDHQDDEERSIHERVCNKHLLSPPSRYCHLPASFGNYNNKQIPQEVSAGWGFPPGCRIGYARSAERTTFPNSCPEAIRRKPSAASSIGKMLSMTGRMPVSVNIRTMAASSSRVPIVEPITRSWR